jgi:xylulokinase
MSGMILSVDIGTSSLKAALIDLDGRLRAFSRAVYPRSCANANAGTNTNANVNVDAAAWERAFTEALENLRLLAPDCIPDGICISGNGPTLVPVLRGGETLPPLYWHGKMILSAEKTGYKTPSFFLPHAAWLKENAPDEYEKTDFFISSHEWLAFRLGAEALTVLPNAAYEPYYWDDEQCRIFGLDRKKFPPFVNMGSIMGRVSPNAASFVCGGSFLKSGTPIIAGGPDFITALIGTGTLKAGDVCDRAGSSEGINVCSAEVPAPADEYAMKGRSIATDGLRVLPHAREGLWNIGAVIPSSGSLFEWYRSITGQEGRDYAEQLAELIPCPDQIELFSDIDLSLLRDGGGRFSPASSPFPIPHSPLTLGRTVLCAMGFAVRSAVETLERRGFPVREMRVSGGQGRNPRWNQLKADITGISLVLPEINDGELAGNAAIAAAALEDASYPDKAGFERTLENACGRMIRFRDVYKPRNSDFWIR